MDGAKFMCAALRRPKQGQEVLLIRARSAAPVSNRPCQIASNFSKTAVFETVDAGASFEAGATERALKTSVRVLFELDIDSSCARARPNACTNIYHSAS